MVSNLPTPGWFLEPEPPLPPPPEETLLLFLPVVPPLPWERAGMSPSCERFGEQPAAPQLPEESQQEWDPFSDLDAVEADPPAGGEEAPAAPVEPPAPPAPERVRHPTEEETELESEGEAPAAGAGVAGIGASALPPSSSYGPLRAHRRPGRAGPLQFVPEGGQASAPTPAISPSPARRGVRGKDDDRQSDVRLASFWQAHVGGDPEAAWDPRVRAIRYEGEQIFMVKNGKRGVSR